MAPRREANPKNALVAVAEASFGRQVLAAPVPVLVVFGAQRCRASRALRPLLHELAELHAGQLRIAVVDAERAPLLAEQIGVQATPTLVIVRDGEIATRAVGFLPPGLLRLLCDQIANNTLPPGPFWSPIEEIFEELVVVPLLDAWGFGYTRQAACPAPARGRIDFLVYDQPLAQPLTLFENKRQIMSADALARAVAQAQAYARALRLPSFVVAAPAGLWIYANTSGAAQMLRRVTSLELAQQPSDLPQLLRQLSRQNSV